MQHQQAAIVHTITNTVPVEKIYMLGSTLQQQQTTSIFITDAPNCQSIQQYWLLVVVHKACGYNENYIQDKIENNCQHLTPVTAIVLTTTQFSNWLQQGHRFACTVVSNAELLYDNTGTPLPIPGTITDTTPTAMDLQKRIQKVNEFMVGTALYQLRHQHAMAAFMLHQATEQALLGIFKKATGLHLSTHNIDKLLRYCTLVDHRIPTVFQRDTAAGEKRFQLLQKAYIDTRYKEDYIITGKDLQALTENIKNLQQIMEQCNSQTAINRAM